MQKEKKNESKGEIPAGDKIIIEHLWLVTDFVLHHKDLGKIVSVSYVPIS